MRFAMRELRKGLLPEVRREVSVQAVVQDRHVPSAGAALGEPFVAPFEVSARFMRTWISPWHRSMSRRRNPACPARVVSPVAP